jgi:hypothetical protein
VKDPETDKEIHPFDQIVNRGIKGTLWALSTVPEGMAHVHWRELIGTDSGRYAVKHNVSVRLPCHIDSAHNECVIVDHREIRVISMPTGDITGERYSLRPSTKCATSFKAMGVSMNDRYILVLGRVRCYVNPIMILINRKDRLVTYYYSDIVITTAQLSTEGKRPLPPAGHEDHQPKSNSDVHLLLGFINGDIIRCPLGEIPNWAVENHQVSRLFVFRPDDPPAKKNKKGKKKDDKATTSVDPHADLIAKFQGLGLNPVVVPLSSACIFGIGSALPVVRIVEHGNRFVAQSADGLHLFRLAAPEGTERRVNIRLLHNVGYDFQGNLLVLHKANNAIQFVQLHDCRLEVRRRRTSLILAR